VANDEHVAVLKKGVDAWNQWRNEMWFYAPPGTPFMYPDLSGANLANADLPFALLYMTELSDADLSGANLTGADFFGSRLSLKKDATERSRGAARCAPAPITQRLSETSAAAAARPFPRPREP
jgi:Pentapeptide repeats (8 copies)